MTDRLLCINLNKFVISVALIAIEIVSQIERYFFSIYIILDLMSFKCFLS